MATTLLSSMGSTPFSNQCFDTADLDSWVDFGTQPSPTPPASSAHLAPSRATSSLSTSSSSGILPSDQQDDHQTPTKPSHEYDLYKQQTGLPSRSVPGLGSEQSNSSGLSDFYNFGTALFETTFSGTSSLDELGAFAGLDMKADGNMDIDMNFQDSLPAFFYPQRNDSSQSEEFIDPSAIDSQEEPQPAVRVWPGMHQQQAQQAALAKAQAQAEQMRKQRLLQQQQQQRQQQQSQQHQKRSSLAAGSSHSKSRAGSHQPIDAHTEATIARVVNQIVKTQNSAVASGDDLSLQGSGMLPHIVRMKKDEEDMDEDERLLASEEGKKLSSKERRQLRNKVSARAFRSRRKEYIGQLEGEVSMKTNECNELRAQNQALMEENARSRAFIEKLLRHPAFHPFLDELSREPAITDSVAVIATSTSMPASTTASSDVSPFIAPSRHVSRDETAQVGMVLIPETTEPPLPLMTGNPWPISNMDIGTFQAPQVFSVLELPEGPAEPLDVNVLSGKTDISFMPTTEDSCKATVPEIERPVPERRSAEQAPAKAPIEFSMADLNNPNFALYIDAPAPDAATSSLEEHISTPLAAPTLSEKSSYELVVISETEDQLARRFERLCARIEPVMTRVEAMTAHLQQ